MSNMQQDSLGENYFDKDSDGIYGTVKKLSEHYADISGTSRKKALSLAYQLLLKKSIPSFEVSDFPTDWDDEDIQNATVLEIHKRFKVKNAMTKELHSKILSYFDVLYKHKDTDLYQNSIGPTLKMLLCLEYNQNKAPQKEKKFDEIFDTRIIPLYLDNINDYRPKEEINFFSFPSIYGPLNSLSFGNIFSFKLENQESLFDFVFRPEHYNKVRSSYDLDEGFVTPNDEHVEKSPCFERGLSKLPPPKIEKKFDWDYKVVSIPPRHDKCWERFDMIGNTTKFLPFIHKDVLLQKWLVTAPEDARKIETERLIHDIIALLLGVPSSTFILEKDNFKIRDNIYTDELVPSGLAASCIDFMKAGEAFIALTDLSEWKLDDDTITSAFKVSLREFLHDYHKFVCLAYDNCKEKSFLEFTMYTAPLIEQVISLSKLLAHGVPLKGVTLLKHLFDLLGAALSSPIFHILSTLFLLPCVYYFRLIDDWIFLGKWHKDLPLTPFSMELVNDRQSWLEAHRSKNIDVPWFLPVKDLAHCGKAISLLSLSKNNEKFLNLLKSNKRPRVKLCFDLKELDELKEDCEKYYEEGVSSFRVNKEEEVDLVQCALDAAQIKTAAFENLRLEEKMKEIKRKKDELCLRENDLIRSAQNKALRKQEDDAEDARVVKECEEIMLKEQREVLERAKAVYARFKHVLEEEQPKKLSSFPAPMNQPTLPKVKKYSSTDDFTKENKTNNFSNIEENQVPLIGDVNDNLSNELEHRTTGVANQNQDNILVDENLNTDLVEESEQNKIIESVISSDINENINPDEIEIKKSESLEVEMPNEDKKTAAIENEHIKITKIEEELSELERNRMKVLGSDLGRGENYRTHIWSDETERNKKNMMESHLCLNYAFEENKKRLTDVLNLSKKSESSDCRMNVSESEDVIINEISSVSERTGINLSEEIENSFVNDTVVTVNEEDKIDGSSNNLFKINWYDTPASNEMLNILKNKNPLFKFISDKDIDCALLHKLLHQSLKTVFNVQVKLVNDALLTMFLNEFGLLKVAQKLSEYFFLHGEFGKRLTSSLSKAVEEEDPGTLLTFYRLRSIFVDACRGDIEEISFVVKETPVAFQHNSSQVLSCLSLAYRIEWPLNLIFTEMAISKYNDVFTYILSLHRVAWHLDEVSYLLNFKPILMRGYQYTQIQLYRHVMSQFVSTLQSYVVTTVIESCWRDFIKDASKVNDLDDLYRRHAVYIKDIKAKCFLGENKVRFMEQIQKLLEDILIFCRILRFGEWNVSANEEYRHSNFEKLRSTFSSFIKLARTVTKYLEKFVKIDYQKEYESLYYFLTLNPFYIS